MKRGAGLLAMLGMVVSGAWASGPVVLPPGPAKATIEAKCKQCHDLKMITKQHQDTTWWVGTLEKMKERGLEIEPEDQQKVLKYLTKNFGKNSKH